MKIQDSKQILVIDFGGVGDILLSSPALRALRSKFPQAEISMLIASRVYEIAESSTYADKIFVFFIGYGGKFPFTKLLKNIMTLLILRRKQFDLAINMRTLVSKGSAKKIKFMLDIIKPKMKAGRDTEGRGDFFDIKIFETTKGQKHEMEYDVDTVRALGAEVIDKNIDFKIDEVHVKRVRRILENENVSKDVILIGIHPGGMPSRRWPIENFSKVIEAIQKKMSPRFVITGGKDEIGLAKRLKNTLDTEAIDLSGKLNVKELGALIKRCNLYISNDTGPMHLAAILKTPLVAIFGPGDITRFNPRHISHRVLVLYERVECAPCEQVECNDLKCLKIISPQDVIKSAFKLLEVS